MLDSVVEVLNELSKVEGITTSLVVDKDGILIASDSYHKSGYSESLASMFARAIYEFEKSTKLTQKDKSTYINQLVIERQNEEKLVMTVTSTFILAVVTQGMSNLGLLRMEIREAIDKLKPLLGE
ncbi:MAG: roadblock/LC7 domain-containing protein [Candidatus Sericytochromatia bacterium]